jgi:DNA-binding NarL/FixJ family response regulator
MKRLMIVADNSFAAQSIRLALRQTTGFQDVGFIDASVPITPRMTELAPDMVVVDDTQEPEHALARLAELVKIVPEAKRVFLTLRMDSETIQQVLERGATAVISKSMHPVSLATVLREIARDAVVMRSPAVIPAKQGDCPLTDRELEILRLVAEGFTNGRIARELWLTEQTVKFHLSNIYRKLGVANRTEASHKGYELDLIERPRILSAA